MTILLGIIHILATNIVYHGGFAQLPAKNGSVFIFMFVSTGLSLIFIGGIAVYSTLVQL
jgi:hypothetical protein